MFQSCARVITRAHLFSQPEGLLVRDRGGLLSCCRLIPMITYCHKPCFNNRLYHHKYQTQSIGPDVGHGPRAYLTDMTLSDQDTNSILTDDANRAIQDK